MALIKSPKADVMLIINRFLTVFASSACGLINLHSTGPPMHFPPIAALPVHSKRLRRSPRSALLATTALTLAGTVVATVLTLAPTSASANDYSLSGGPAISFASNVNPWPVWSGSIAFNITSTQNSSLYAWSQNLTASAAPVTWNVNASINSALEGIYTTAWASDITANINGAITSGGVGVRLWNNFATDGGSTTVRGNGSINAGSHGIWVFYTNGAVTIDGFGGGITAGGVGVLVETGGTGAWTAAAREAINIGQNQVLGPINSGSDGISVITLYNPSGEGDIKIHASSINSTAGNGVSVVTQQANTTVVTDGLVNAGVNGIAVATTSGNIDVTTNGAVTGGIDGIYAASTTGDVTVTNNAKVSSTAGGGLTAGIVLSAIGGKGLINANADVYGNNAGIYTIAGAAGTTTNIAAGVTVWGKNYGVVASGGVNVVNNFGTITTAADYGKTSLGSVGPTDTAVTPAFWSWGNTSATLNNFGIVTGGLASDTGSTTINNAGILNLLAASQTTTGMTINNSGLMNVYAGTTTLLGATVTNQDGGFIDLTNNSAATDSLVIQNFSAKAGSFLNLNFDSKASNNAALGWDNSTDGKGTADTIVVTSLSSPTSSSTINLSFINGLPTSMAGAVALVYTGKNLNAPTLGSTLSASQFYKLGFDPSNGRIVYSLVDDGQGGVYLEWAPNVSAGSLGGYLGGTVGNPESKSGAVAVAAGAFGGLGGVGGGGGVSSGASGQVGDAAADAAQDMQSGGKKGEESCKRRLGWNVWTQGDVSSTTFSGSKSGSGNARAGSLGVEHDLGRYLGASCGTLVAGVFSTVGYASTALSSGTNATNSYGLGTYARVATPWGLYGSVVAGWTNTNADLFNSAYNAWAKQTGKASAVVGMVGLTREILPSLWFDLRGFASTGAVKGDGFFDTNNFKIDYTRHNLTTFGASLGFNYRLAEGISAFLRGGERWVHQNDRISAFSGNAIRGGSFNARFTVIEGGLAATVLENVNLSAAAHYNKGSNSSEVGGAARALIKF